MLNLFVAYLIGVISYFICSLICIGLFINKKNNPDLGLRVANRSVLSFMSFFASLIWFISIFISIGYFISLLISYIKFGDILDSFFDSIENCFDEFWLLFEKDKNEKDNLEK
jgi:hypothetical protein